MIADGKANDCEKAPVDAKPGILRALALRLLP